MGDVCIQAVEMGKRYRIGQREPYHSLRDELTKVLGTPGRWWSRVRHRQLTQGHQIHDMIWALRRVSFEVKRGEVIGVIGRNGAGKTTLLKILSRITEPTEGRAMICGRVGSLLEVGTGFHPELTGRENIYLNGAILGMRRKEIERKFDAIVAFAEVEPFMDTPVKRFSSGMYVRLAFAVAAHLEPEVLLVDEVLSVGDIAFQRKCMEKMSDIADSGRTIMFVSHNLPSIARLCSRGIWLKDGVIAEDGEIQRVVARYQADALGRTIAGNGRGNLPCVRRKRFSDDVVLQSCVLQDLDGREATVLPYRSGCQVVVRVTVNRAGIQRSSVHLWIGLSSYGDSLIFLSSGELPLKDAEPGDVLECVFRVADLRLTAGLYEISAGCKVAGMWTDVAYSVQSFQVGHEEVMFQEANADAAPLSVEYDATSKVVCANARPDG